jgi:hypothetical protein
MWQRVPPPRPPAEPCPRPMGFCMCTWFAYVHVHTRPQLETARQLRQSVGNRLTKYDQTLIKYVKNKQTHVTFFQGCHFLRKKPCGNAPQRRQGLLIIPNPYIYISIYPYIHIPRQLDNCLKYKAVKNQGSQLNNRLDPTDGYVVHDVHMTFKLWCHTIFVWSWRFRIMLVATQPGLPEAILSVLNEGHPQEVPI